MLVEKVPAGVVIVKPHQYRISAAVATEIEETRAVIEEASAAASKLLPKGVRDRKE